MLSCSRNAVHVGRHLLSLHRAAHAVRMTVGRDAGWSGFREILNHPSRNADKVASELGNARLCYTD